MPIRALLLAVTAGGVLALTPPASACTGTVCDAVNRVCSLGGGGGCLPE